MSKVKLYSTAKKLSVWHIMTSTCGSRAILSYRGQANLTKTLKHDMAGFRVFLSLSPSSLRWENMDDQCR